MHDQRASTGTCGEFTDLREGPGCRVDGEGRDVVGCVVGRVDDAVVVCDGCRYVIYRDAIVDRIRTRCRMGYGRCVGAFNGGVIHSCYGNRLWRAEV